MTPDLFLSLRDRTSRDQHGLYMAEGLRALHAAVAHQAPIAGIAICRDLFHSAEARRAVQSLQGMGCPLIRLRSDQFRTLSQAAEPQGVLLAIRQRWQPLPSKISRKDLWIGVEHVRSPGNLGTLLRSAHAVGATGLMVFGPSRHRADPYDPGCVRASMGSAFALQIVSTHHQAFRKWPRRWELRVFGGDGSTSTDYRRVSFRKPTMLMMGEERHGLSEAQVASCDGLVRIPMCPGPDSLNFAMAGTVLLYEVYNQRHPV